MEPLSWAWCQAGPPTHDFPALPATLCDLSSGYPFAETRTQSPKSRVAASPRCLPAENRDPSPSSPSRLTSRVQVPCGLKGQSLPDWSSWPDIEDNRFFFAC